MAATKESLTDKFLWPLLGLGLVIFGCYLIFKHDQKWGALVLLVGLLMVSFDKARLVVDYARKVIKEFRTEPAKSEPETDSEDGKRRGVINEDAPPPDVDEWVRTLRPVLYQASHYSVPTYYLNNKLQVIDWNIGFELIFREVLGNIRNKHVNYFIYELANREQVFDHAREFTKRVRRGEMALVDLEDLSFSSPKYGAIQFAKVAAVLNDTRGEQKGWSVSLLIKEIEWGLFLKDLEMKAREDKLWSVYAGPYDRILLHYPPYIKLIQDVIDAIPAPDMSVLDLGSGTGNVVSALLERGHRVTAVENNIAMLEKLRAHGFDSSRTTIIKASAEILDSLDAKLNGTFDAVVMVNVLYAVSDPLACLQSVNRLMKPGGILSFSTTHSETRLDPLLESIKNHLKETERYVSLADDYELLRVANKDIEQTIALRYSRDDYLKWVKTAGFTVIKVVPSTYEGAVMIVHAVKPGG